MRNLLLLVVAVLGMGTAQAQDMMMDKKMDMDMGEKMMMLERTEALVILGTTGMTKAYAMEQGGEYKGKITGAFVSAKPFAKALTMKEMDMNAGIGGFAPETAEVDGKLFRMVAPSVVKDNFVVLLKSGEVYRYDLGVDEGTNKLTLVGKY